jgi:predicted DNA-binding protein with PD1-like motif
MKLLKLLSITALMLNTGLAIAADQDKNSAAVTKSTCNRLANTTQAFILVLNPGDKLIASITQCAKEAKLLGASISGVGQLQNPTLAYFTSDPNAKPSLKKFNGFYELASLSGDITNNSSNYYTHLHTVLADKQFHGISGHIDNATVGLTAEITITPLSAPLKRMVNAKTGFGPIIS